MNLNDVIKVTFLTVIMFYMISATWRRRSQSYKVQTQWRSLTDTPFQYVQYVGALSTFTKV